MERTVDPATTMTFARSHRRPNWLLRQGDAVRSGVDPDWRGARRGLALGVLSAALISCSDMPTYVPHNSGPALARAAHFWESNAAVYWNAVARDMVVVNRSPAPFAIRGYAIVSVAQYNAAVTAEKEKLGREHPSVDAAIAAASVTALAYLYPSQGSTLEGLLADYLADPGWPGERRRDITSGVAIGRAIGEQIVARARTDNFFAPGTVEVPAGPCLWFSGSTPVGALWGQAKTFLLLSADQFRPPPPPPCESPEFDAAVAEVRQISDTRTPEQDANAKFWDLPVGTYTPPGYWNEEAATLAVKYRRTERESAHVFAMMNMVSFDAIVSSHAAKYHYWVARPSMIDPSITLSIPLPNFPSYPSNHAAVSAGMAHVLGHTFPAERTRLEALADEAALSRVLAGIHYRFDGEAGLAMGRAIAAWALANHVHGPDPFMLQ